MADINRRFSPYDYVSNSPVNRIDPDGMIDNDLLIPLSDKIDRIHDEKVAEKQRKSEELVAGTVARLGLGWKGVGTTNCCLTGGPNERPVASRDSHLQTKKIDRKPLIINVPRLPNGTPLIQPTISAYNPGGLTGVFNNLQQGNFLSKFVYDALDPFNVYLTHLFGFDGAGGSGLHLNGLPALRSELINSGVDVVTSFLPAAKAEEIVIGGGAKVLNVAQFNTLYKGTGVTARMPNALKIFNNNIRVGISFVHDWGYVNKGIGYGKEIYSQTKEK